MIITLSERPGRCRWCDCSDQVGCVLGCRWINARHTLCSACEALDRLVRTREGRVALAEIVQSEAALTLS